MTVQKYLTYQSNISLRYSVHTRYKYKTVLCEPKGAIGVTPKLVLQKGIWLKIQQWRWKFGTQRGKGMSFLCDKDRHNRNVIRRLKKYKESVNTKKVSKLARNTSNPCHSPAATAMPNRSNICEQNRCYGQHKIMCIGPKTIHVSVGRTSSAWISPYRHEWFKVGLDNMIKKKKYKNI